MIIGVDFDNTIVNYDGLMHSIAVECGIIDCAIGKSKTQIRNAVRRGPDGELNWQRIQAQAYGPRMCEAVPSEGVKEFFLACRLRGIRVWIVSHKTTYSNLGESRVNFHGAALDWLEQEGFFRRDGIGMSREDVYFEPSRSEKVARIVRLGITHFIDDLEETFTEATFPEQVQKILYSRESPQHVTSATRLETWGQIQEYLLRRTSSVASDDLFKR